MSRRKESQIIEQLFSNRKIDELSEYITQNSDLNLIELIDAQGNTILHQLAFEGHLDIIKLFVKSAKKYIAKKTALQRKQIYQKDESQEITTWMNKKNNEGFTALLYASYSGHIDIIKYLMEDYHVNQKLTTNSGLNPLHLAAQKNMILPFLYFKEKVGINQTDSMLSSPLHWASYMNNEEVVAYLITKKDLLTLNSQDSEGNTPLMLAVSYGNTRVVRRLLIKGANRYVKNNLGQMAMDIAKESNYNTISKMLNQNFSCLDLIKLYCNVKIEYKPKRRKMTIPAIFLIAFFLNVTILNFLIEFSQNYFLYAEGLVMVIMLLLYLTLLIGPGTPQPKDLNQILQNGKQKALKHFCFQCKITTPKRGYHCDTCGVCIRQYDHHCTWINNCVGKRNIGRFMLFLFFLILCLGLVGLISFLSEISLIIDDYQIYDKWFVFRYEHQDIYEKISLISLFVINFVTSLFIFPVLALFIVQIKNLLKNKTTYEFMKGPAVEPNQIKDRIRKYDSRVSLRNCKMMCSDNTSSFTTTRSNANKFQSEKMDSHYHS